MSQADNSSLKSFIQQVTGDEYLRVQDDLGNGYVRLRAAEAQRRQAKQDIRSFEDVVLEMLRNARDAHAHSIFVATRTEKSMRVLTMLDDGEGIPTSLHETVFEPFVTSKLDSFHTDRWGVHGRGMALYSIRENTDKASVVASESGRGSVIQVEASLATLPEKKDQSTIPVITRNESGGFILKGPHNIIRTVMEFALNEREHLRVFLGSPTEIAATLYSEGMKRYLAQSQLPQSSVQKNISDNVPFVYMLGTVHNPDVFAELASSLGLALSSRSARRILDGTIVPLEPLIDYLKLSAATGTVQRQKSERVKKTHVHKDQRGLKLSANDLTAFKNSLLPAYQALAKAYYLEPQVEPRISVTKHSISVSWEVEKLT